MNKTVRVGLLSVVVIAQAVTVIGTQVASMQMAKSILKLQTDYKQLYEETHPLIIDYGIIDTSFTPFSWVTLLGLFLAVVLLADHVLQKTANSSKSEGFLHS